MNDPDCARLYYDRLKAFDASLEANHGQGHAAEFTLFMPHIYNVSGELIENLFCRQLKYFKSVDELLSYKFQNGTSASKSSVVSNNTMGISNNLNYSVPSSPSSQTNSDKIGEKDHSPSQRSHQVEEEKDEKEKEKTAAAEDNKKIDSNAIVSSTAYSVSSSSNDLDEPKPVSSSETSN